MGSLINNTVNITIFYWPFSYISKITKNYTIIFIKIMRRKHICIINQCFTRKHKVNKSNTKVSKHYWIICLYSINVSKFVKGWGDIKNPLYFFIYCHKQLLQHLFLYYYYRNQLLQHLFLYFTITSSYNTFSFIITMTSSYKTFSFNITITSSYNTFSSQ